jgi:hypothetical protein
VVDPRGFEPEAVQFATDIATSRTEVPNAESFKSSEAQQPESESMLSQVASDIVHSRSHFPSDCEFPNQQKGNQRSRSHQVSMQTDSEEAGCGTFPEPPAYRPPDVEKELRSSSNYVPHGPNESEGMDEPQQSVNKVVDYFSSCGSSSTESLADPNAAEMHHSSSMQDSCTQTTPRLESRLPDAFRRMRDIELKFRATLETFAKEGNSVEMLDSRAAHAGG